VKHLAAVVLALLIPVAALAADVDKQKATNAAKFWLSAVDANEYARSWKAASAFLESHVTDDGSSHRAQHCGRRFYHHPARGTGWQIRRRKVRYKVREQSCGNRDNNDGDGGRPLENRRVLCAVRARLRSAAEFSSRGRARNTPKIMSKMNGGRRLPNEDRDSSPALTRGLRSVYCAASCGARLQRVCNDFKDLPCSRSSAAAENNIGLPRTT
jgi:hypothetical protein